MPFFACVFSLTAEKPKGIAPEILTPLQNLTVVEGKPANLECEVKGEPQPNIEWFKDGEQVKQSERINLNFEGNFASLSFKPAELDDEGEYKCVARNELGSASSEAELLVEEAETKPDFKEELKNVSVLPRAEARFDVRVMGVPPPEVDWFKGKQKIEDEGRFILIDDEEDDLFSLVIEEARPSDSGEYECVAFNEVGEVSCKSKLIVGETLIPREEAEEAESALPAVEESITVPESAAKVESALVMEQEGGDVKGSQEKNSILTVCSCVLLSFKGSPSKPSVNILQCEVNLSEMLRMWIGGPFV